VNWYDEDDDNMAVTEIAANQKANMAEEGISGAAAEGGVAAAAGANPYVAAATIGGKFLTSYLERQAAEEAARMKAIQGAIGQQGQATNDALNQRLAAYARALR
jgi:hypothetical protein